ncbi:Protein phosphatase 2C-like protein [Zancudomyces culisetae]|uniref:protein-serine/threonine phosphatase n=1 Tax=Zancudomyces culisetae TaxID=1213189 RepID=A0A1R1PGH3_ZANCU|nr:Protein phosphatase 2C-like protein [Zancudomyces culisetae]|eukprot:OMH79952.1 Protein phosphatase 2C-like protein [Zancudomyces culisetae]
MKIAMEDAHTTLLKIDEKTNIAFYAVFDGHGESEKFKSGEYEEALKEGFMKADAEIIQTTERVFDPSGCAAVCVMILPDGTVYCANAGDSRAVLSTAGGVVDLSHDHKPTNAEEYQRINAGGGFVEYGRVNGNLALSRALGDFEFKGNPKLEAKDQVVTAYPEVIVHNEDSSKPSEFIVLACDGIWDCMTNGQVVEFVRRHIALGLKLESICESLMMSCLATENELTGIGCDNMSVVLIGILHGKTVEQWYDHIKADYIAAHGVPEPLGSDQRLEHAEYVEQIEEVSSSISASGEATISTTSTTTAMSVDTESDPESASDAKKADLPATQNIAADSEAEAANSAPQKLSQSGESDSNSSNPDSKTENQ